MITKADLGNFQGGDHYNRGSLGGGWGSRCVKYPRLYFIDWHFKKTRTVEREWTVDGEKVADLEAAIAALNKPPILTLGELAWLEKMPSEWTPLRKLEADLGGIEVCYVWMHALASKGMIEYGKSPERSDGEPWGDSVPEHQRYSPTVRRRPQEAA